MWKKVIVGESYFLIQNLCTPQQLLTYLWKL